VEFLVKIRCSDALRQKDVIQDLRDGLHLIVGSGEPYDEYLQKLSEVKVLKYKVPKKLIPIGRTSNDKN
jgi:hypothetical protein